MRARRSFVAALALVMGCQGEPPPPSGVTPTVAAPDPSVVRLLGSGAFTPLARRLVSAWPKPSGAPRYSVEASVGSGGGARATADGAVDLGLLARPLKPAESALGLIAFPIAVDAVVIAAHRDVPVDGLDGGTLTALAWGRVTTFADGTNAVVLLRDREESANEAIERLLPDLKPAREDAYRTQRLRVLYHDDAMGEALAATPGSLGVFSLGAVTIAKLPLKVLAIDGVTPSQATIADGTWRATRTLCFAVRKDRQDRVREFLQFVASAEGRKVIESAGYVPLPSSGASP